MLAPQTPDVLLPWLESNEVGTNGRAGFIKGFVALLENPEVRFYSTKNLDYEG